MIKIKAFKVGRLKTNCYLIADDSTGHGVLIDPGGEIRNFKDEILQFDIDYILLTHGHFDHILNARKYRSMTNSKIVISEEDAEFTNNNNLNLSEKFLRPNTLEHFDADILVKDNSIIPFQDKKIVVLSTPGHTRGSVCYILEDKIFSGDTLFFRDIGYSGFPTGSKTDMKKSLKKLNDLKGEYTIYPGHSNCTSLNEERYNNTLFV